VATNMINFFTGAWSLVAPFFNVLSQQVTLLAGEFQALFVELGVLSRDENGSLMSSGEALARIFQMISIAIIGVVTGIVWLIRKFVELGRIMARAQATMTDGFTVLSIRVNTIFANMIDSIRNSIDSIIVFIGNMIQRIPAGFRPQGLDNMIRSGMEAEGRISERTATMASRTSEARRAEVVEGTTATRAFEAEAAARSTLRDRQMDTVVRALREERARDREEAKRPIEVHIDGERVATAVAGANRRQGARGFVPTPTDS
ncbi:MAG TPA: hypothetical protein VJ044_03505, partial [Candidatus Hodarchaeales archaeon]|nr:hypothetical protein [Candidatus Hodarchaeales archaeon]